MSMSIKLMTYEDMIDHYKDNGCLAKFGAFEDSDFFTIEEEPLMCELLKIINEKIFTTQKVLVPAEVRTVFGNVLGIFNFEFVNYFILHSHRKEIYKNKLERIDSSETIEDLRENIYSMKNFLGIPIDCQEIEVAVSQKDFSKIMSLKNSFIQVFSDYFEDGSVLINSIDDFVCSTETAYYDGSFTMNAKKLLTEFFSGYPYKLTPKMKYKLLINMFRENVEGVDFDTFRIEIVGHFKKYTDLLKTDVEVNFTEDFWNEFADVIACFVLQFGKEVAMECMFNFKNTKLRIKTTNIENIMRSICPRDVILNWSQINFLRYVSKTKANLKATLSKKFGYKESSENSEKSPDKSADKSAEKPAEESHENSNEESHDESHEKTIEKSAEKSAKKPAKKHVKNVVDESHQDPKTIKELMELPRDEVPTNLIRIYDSEREKQQREESFKKMLNEIANNDVEKPAEESLENDVDNDFEKSDDDNLEKDNIDDNLEDSDDDDYNPFAITPPKNDSESDKNDDFEEEIHETSDDDDDYNPFATIPSKNEPENDDDSDDYNPFI